MPDKTHIFIEDAASAGTSVADPDVVLNDDELRSGGLVPVQTWVRTKASRNALRAQRSRERAEKGEGGSARKQVSLLAPPDDEARSALREVGRLMVAGELSVSDLCNLGRSIEQPDDAATQIGRRVLNLIEGGGLRGRLLKRLVGYHSR